MVFAKPNGELDQGTAPNSSNKLYFAAWRWHFYAGLYVIPIFAILAVTGMAMAWIAHIDGRDGEYISVVVQESTKPVSVQADAALVAIPGGTVKQYVAPRADDLASIFRIDLGEVATMVVVDPYTATVLAKYPRRSGWYDFVNDVHGDMLLGVTGIG